MEEPVGQKNGKSKVLHGCCIASAVVIILLAVFIVYAGNKVFETKKSTPNLYRITRNTSIHFPAGSKLIHSYMEGWQDFELAAVVEMKPQDVKAFINSLPSDSYTKWHISRSDRLGVTKSMSRFTMERNWWNPDRVMKFIAVDTDYSDDHIYMLLDQDDPITTRVYLYWIDT